MRNFVRCAFALMLIPAAGFAATPEFEESRVRTEPVVAMLAARTDADSLAAAGLLSSFYDRAQSLRLVSQASRVAPDRAELLWLHIQMCREVASCDTEPLERRIRILDPKNGSGWFAALERATRNADAAAKSAALDAIARSERVDTYWTTLIARLTPPIVSTNKESLLNAMSEVVGVLAAIAIPAYSFTSNSCKGDGLAREDVMTVCRGIADSLSNGDTIVTEMLGRGIKQRVWPEGSPKWLEASETKRTRDYRNQFATGVSDWMLADPAKYLALCGQHRREQDVEKAILIEIGKDPDPPASE